MLLLIYMYLRAPCKIGYNQMGHPRKIKKLLTLLTCKNLLKGWLLDMEFTENSDLEFFMRNLQELV